LAWIESHQSLKDHPKTRRFARVLGISVPAAIGHLQCLWWWALEYAQDGDLSQYDNAEIADACLWERDPDSFVEAMSEARFLDANRSIHDWDDYAGKLIARRQANTQRKRQARAGVSCGHPPPVLQPSEATVPNRTVPNPTVPPPSGGPGGQAPKKKRETLVDEAFRVTMVERFGTVLGGRTGIDERIDELLKHTSAKKWTDEQAGVRNWLRRDFERLNGRGPPGRRAQPSTNPKDFERF
jgi:hypothetical protein